MEMVELLLEQNANINIANSYGQTPLYFACGHNNPAIIILLLENGADGLDLNETIRSNKTVNVWYETRQ
jgi:ankyrin repeat protein